MQKNVILKTITHPTFYQWNLGIILAAIFFFLIKYFDPNSSSALPTSLLLLFLVNLLATSISSYKLVTNSWNIEKFMRRGPIIGMYPFCIVLGIIGAFLPKYFAVVILFLAASPFILMEVLSLSFIILYLISFALSFMITSYFFNRAGLYENLTPLVFSSLMLVIYVFWLFIQARYFQSKDRQIKGLLRESRKNRRLVEEERAKSDLLLKNILPEEIARELKENNATVPKFFESATILFTDFQGFTKIAEHLLPGELIAELDKCFSYFDSLMDRYGLEKLKTIGDSYMCAGGIPATNNTHAIDCVLAAMEIRSIMQKMKEIKEMQNIPYWELRIGINTGPVIAGVIGAKKFSYDVWGDTVNTASRLESSGAVGKINISGSTRDLVNLFFDCEYRGRVPAKNKGEIDMYFVHGIHPELSINGEMNVPNEKFLTLYKKLQSRAEK